LIVDKDKCVNILGVPTGIFTMCTLLDRIEKLIAAPGCAVGHGVNAHVLNLTYHHPEFLKALRQADLLYADGASLILASRLLGGNLPEKLTTTDVWPKLCEIAVQKGYRFFLLGGEPGLAEQAASQAQKTYQGLHIVGTQHGYFDFRNEQIIAGINAVRPDILWVGMGDPRQVLWTAKWRQQLQVSLILTCGGMFKIVAGELERLSPTLRQNGFEWAYRLWQEPATWRRYLLGLPLFGARVLDQALKNGEGRFKSGQKSSSAR
jgi:N-acetylglucosaminyldiphosphoundecaprenol N-acetyl-beta-D-mannosaminyltransferase